MSPDPRPIPRFIADSCQHGIPSGRFAERLATPMREACEAIEDLPEGVEAPDSFDWFPERAWGGRIWVPASGRAELPGGGQIELFGAVSFIQPEGGDPEDIRATADFTDVLAEHNRDWRIDLGDEVIGRWNGENGRAADITLVWGRSLVRGAFAATAEVEGTTVDQEPLIRDRFTLIAPDALTGYGDDMFLEVLLWTNRGKQLAAESLYDDVEEEEAESTGGAEEGSGADGEAGDGDDGDRLDDRAGNR